MIHVEIRPSWSFLSYPGEMIWACLTYVKSHLSVARKKIFVKKFFDTSRYLPSPEARFILIYDLHRYLKPLGRKVLVKNFNTNIFAVFGKFDKKSIKRKKFFLIIFIFPYSFIKWFEAHKKAFFTRFRYIKLEAKPKAFIGSIGPYRAYSWQTMTLRDPSKKRQVDFKCQKNGRLRLRGLNKIYSVGV